MSAQLTCRLRIGTPRGEINFKPCAQNRILVPLRVSFSCPFYMRVLPLPLPPGKITPVYPWKVTRQAHSNSMQSTYTSFLNNYLIQKQTSATVHKTNPLPLRKNLLNRCYICCGKDAIRLSVTKPSRSSAFFQLSCLRELSAEDLLEFHSCVS